MCAALRRRRPSQAFAETLGPGLRFSLHKGPASSIIVPVSVISSCVDIPLIHLLLNSHLSAAVRAPFHVALLVLNAGALAWIIGERSAVTHVPHVVGPVMLRLRVGFRVAFDIPLSAVRGVHPLAGSRREWMPARRLTRDDVTLVTPMDEPNVLLDIGGTRFLAIRVDDPEGFRRALAPAR
jgi:hypothetical protein